MTAAAGVVTGCGRGAAAPIDHIATAKRNPGRHNERTARAVNKGPRTTTGWPPTPWQSPVGPPP
jgi:hypothetical protein